MEEPFEEFGTAQPVVESPSRDNTLNDDELIFKELVTKALEYGEHAEFEFIKNYAELNAIKLCKSGLRKVIKVFKTVTSGIYKEYCRLVETGESDFNLLYAYNQYLEVLKYYEQELAIANDMIDEYDNYVWSGHLIDQYLLFKTRPEEDLVDTRKPKNGTK